MVSADASLPRPRLLDLFCCQGGAGKGYADAGFEVTGVDVDPQPLYPFTFHQADANTYPFDGFDALHASPPCQDHSASLRLHGKEHETGWMLAHITKRFQSSGLPYVIENVVGAAMNAPAMLCGTTFGLGLHRHRLFEASFELMSPGCDPSAVRHRGRDAQVFGHHANSKRVREEWGVEWMTRYGIAQSIPPVFAQYVGERLMRVVLERKLTTTRS